VRRRRRRRRRALLKSSNPHLAGGEKLKLKKYGKQIKTMKTWGTKKMGKKLKKITIEAPPQTLWYSIRKQKLATIGHHHTNRVLTL
jgi:hypothetical protein